ncbi:hypothetical protein ABEV34_11735 [Methylorubrum rhodesianum]|uniref:hypothetical protein n=1 Tax=Methylorubrum TaxID=2282523 RepID=UPI00160FCE41|nr:MULTISPECIES: hypothetical protein [Methylorubrum]MBB5765906.1 hypothetical protein [Methylorubrum rhodesianum]MBI1691494.1 hypothetical protein [Methylorubrum sp. DB1722]
MADSSPTVGELFKAKAVTVQQVDAAVEAYLTDLEASAFPIADGYVVDLDSAVAEHFGVSLLVSDEEANTDLKRGAVRTAILLARAQKV